MLGTGIRSAREVLLIEKMPDEKLPEKNEKMQKGHPARNIWELQVENWACWPEICKPQDAVQSVEAFWVPPGGP